VIVETYRLTASNSDILAAPSRLASIPYGGFLTLEFQASVNDGTNNYAITVQLPDGTTPIENVGIPKGTVAGQINSDDKYSVTFPIDVGGHCLVGATLSGSGQLEVRATLMP